MRRVLKIEAGDDRQRDHGAEDVSQTHWEEEASPVAGCGEKSAHSPPGTEQGEQPVWPNGDGMVSYTWQAYSRDDGEQKADVGKLR